MSDSQTADVRIQNLRSTTAQWIASADQKASALLSLCGTVLALATLAFALPGSRPSAGVEVALVVFVVTDVVAAVCALRALWPRTNRKSILAEAGIDEKAALPHSPTFFADVAALDVKQFEKVVEDAVAADLQKDAREQAIVVCRIARAKMVAMRWSIGCVLVALVALAVAAIGAGFGK